MHRLLAPVVLLFLAAPFHGGAQAPANAPRSPAKSLANTPTSSPPEASPALAPVTPSPANTPSESGFPADVPASRGPPSPPMPFEAGSPEVAPAPAVAGGDTSGGTRICWAGFDLGGLLAAWALLSFY